MTAIVHESAPPSAAPPFGSGAGEAWALERFAPRPDRHEAAWLVERRQASFDWVARHGFPSRKDEDWKYARLDPIRTTGFTPAPPPGEATCSSDVLDGLTTDFGGTRLVFVNGHLVSERSRWGSLPEGATVTSLAGALAAGGSPARQLVVRATKPPPHAFAALNTALAPDGALVHLAAGTVVDEPIELVFLSVAGESPLVSSPRSMLFAGRDSAMTVVETHVGARGDLYWSNSVTEVVLDEGARVEHSKIQDEAATAFHLALLDVRQGRSSRFRSQVAMLGSSIARHEVRVALEGRGSEVDLDGLYLPRGAQYHDNPVLVDHTAPDCISQQLYKGIVDGGGHGVFNGHIIVRPGALGTLANQTNKNLLLSDRAEADTRPRLEIRADDVQCTHGATVGRLDEEALFYLRSRGIPEHPARGMLTFAFASEMVERFRSAPVRSRVERLVADRLALDVLPPGVDPDVRRPSGDRPR